MHALHVLTPPPTPRLCGIFVRSLNCSFQIYSSQKKRGSVQQERDCFTSRPCKKRGDLKNSHIQTELSSAPFYFTGLWMTYNVHYLENVFLLQLIIPHFDKWMTIMSSLIYEIED